MRLLLFVILLLTISSCSETETIPLVPPFEDRDISLEEKMKIALSENYLTQIGLPDTCLTFLKSYYSSRNYEPRWINDSTLNEIGVKMKGVLDKSYTIGIPEGRTIRCKTENFIQDELNITLSLSQVIYDLQEGFIDYEAKKSKPNRQVPYSKLDELANFSQEEDLRYQFIKYGPQDSTYDVLSKGLIRMIDTYPLDTTTFDLVSIKYDTLHAVEKTRIALISKGYIKESVTDSVGIIDGLIRFQVDNGLKPDGVIGKYTSQALNESSYRKMERVLLAMDKIRAQRSYPEKYIRINIPEYKLRFYADDTLRSEHNIVVGKYENQTPELESKLRKIVVYPFWKVPYSISSKEILPAVKYNTGYLEKHNYKIFKQDIEVDPYTVNWKKIRQNAFPYKVIQQPGPKNSLGILKFDFYNEHSVYFHDTPAKGLFGADVRAYSHGCMRTHKPIDLAKAILHFDSLSPRRMNAIRPDSLDSLLGLEENYEIQIKDRFPIYVDYLTVTRDVDQNMVIYLDIYGRDEEYLKIMRN